MFVGLEDIGFEFNTYYPCVANRIKFGRQHKVILYVDYVMFSHIKPKANYKLKECINYNYSNNGEVKANRGKLHEYLGTTFDFTEKGKVNINRDDYVERMISYFPMKISKSDTDLTPSGNNIFEKVTEKIW